MGQRATKVTHKSASVPKSGSAGKPVANIMMNNNNSKLHIAQMEEAMKDKSRNSLLERQLNQSIVISSGSVKDSTTFMNNKSLDNNAGIYSRSSAINKNENIDDKRWTAANLIEFYGRFSRNTKFQGEQQQLVQMLPPTMTAAEKMAILKHYNIYETSGTSKAGIYGSWPQSQQLQQQSQGNRHDQLLEKKLEVSKLRKQLIEERNRPK